MDSSLDRRSLLKGLGIAGLGGLAGAGGLAGLPRPVAGRPRIPGGVAACTPGCVLTPQQTEGPYYFDANQLRTDITEGLPGAPMRLVVGLQDVDGCAPIPDAIVDVWHCHALGLYSGYLQPGGDTRGEDFLRGIQIADANGEVEFMTIYPGWYQGRTAHLHFKVRFSQTTYVTSQLYFPQEVSNTVYTTRAPYSTRGIGSVTNANDGIFLGTPNNQRLMLTVTPEGDGYLATIVIGVQGLSTAAETAPPTPRAALGAPFPNPTPSVSTLWLTLPRAAERVRVAVFDAEGREVARLHEGPLLAGRHAVEFDGTALPTGVYVVRADVGREVLVETVAVAR